MNYYALLRLPGCIGSIDCVHVGWDCCPAECRSNATGKEGYLSLSFEVIVSHMRRILTVSSGDWGSWQDKTIVTYDEAVQKIRSDPKYKNFIWRTWSKDGSVAVVHKGVYLICHGGYLDWKVLVPPYKHQVEGRPEHRWSKWLESLRKDVECSFGSLKKRFSSLKNRSRYHDAETLEAVFTCCCILHNMNHYYDKLDDVELDGDELDDALHLQNTEHDGEVEVVDNLLKCYLL